MFICATAAAPDRLFQFLPGFGFLLSCCWVPDSLSFTASLQLSSNTHLLLSLRDLRTVGRTPLPFQTGDTFHIHQAHMPGISTPSKRCRQTISMLGERNHLHFWLMWCRKQGKKRNLSCLLWFRLFCRAAMCGSPSWPRTRRLN